MDWKKVLLGIAPTIAKMLIPGSPLIAAASQAVSKAILGKDEGTDAELTAALTGPEAVANLAKLKEVDLAMEKQAGDFAVQFEQLQASDRASARDMQKTTRSKVPAWLAAGVTLGFFGLIAVMCTTTIPAENRSTLDILVGSIGTAWVTIITFYFGSSSSSRQKDDVLGRVAESGKAI